MTVTSPVAATPSTPTLGASPENGGARTLGQDAFLTLLVTQLQHQDPTQPQDDAQFIAQLATFSQLEKLASIDTSIKTLTALLLTAALSPAGPTPTTPAPPDSTMPGEETTAQIPATGGQQ